MGENETALQVGSYNDIIIFPVQWSIVCLSVSVCLSIHLCFSLQWHQRALEIAEETGSVRSQGRAYGNLGLTYEELGNYERAVACQVNTRYGHRLSIILTRYSSGRSNNENKCLKKWKAVGRRQDQDGPF